VSNPFIGVHTVVLGGKKHELDLRFGVKHLRKFDRKMNEIFNRGSGAIFSRDSGTLPIDFTIWCLVIGCGQSYRSLHNSTLTDTMVADWWQQMSLDERAPVNVAISKVMLVTIHGMKPADVDALMDAALEDDEGPLDGTKEGDDTPEAGPTE